jgi:ABC-type bacteriocin/lantibiotic exporter with double-glycine peptidase domain
VSSSTLKLDLLIAVGVAILLIIISPGLAVVGLIALVALVVCAGSFVFDRRRARRSGRDRRPPARRPPARPARRR